MTSTNESAPRAIIVGGGVGGLATAVRLLAAGRRVTVLERAAAPGGKMRRISVGGRDFDGGPTVMTMPWVFEDLCKTAGLRTSDLITLTPLDPLCRHFFSDGSHLDLYNDEPIPEGAKDELAWTRSAEEIGRVIGSNAAKQYDRFRRHAARIFRAVKDPFLLQPMPANPLALVLTRDVAELRGLLHIDAHRSMWRALGAFFDDPRLRVLLARYATYSGADPFKAPATLSVIPHVEFAFGVYAVKGGMYSVAQALCELIVRLGGELRCNADVERIELDSTERRALAVHVGGERLTANDIIVNCDVASLYARLLPNTRLGARRRTKIQALPPSLSAYLNLIVAEQAKALPICHHNVFFSADYEREFKELRERPPTDPTVYLCAPDFGQDAQRWFFLTNSPAIEKGNAPTPSSHAWTALQQRECRDRVSAKLMQHGIDLQEHARAEQMVTPRDFATLFPQSRGALYGAAASSRLAAFKRPPNKVPGVNNLYCVGGSTHPGAGVPMVMLSARIVAELILNDQEDVRTTARVEESHVQASRF